MKKYTIEFIGTFFLVLTIALSSNPIAIGFVLAAMVYMGGYISGAHYNPAVTLGALIAKKIETQTAIRYMITQLIAAIVASGVFYLIHGSPFVPQIASTASITSAVLVEILFTFLLVSVVLHTAATEKTKGNSYFGLAIGVTVMAGAFSAGPISGGAFNPAVGLGPILFDIAHISSHMTSFFVYLIAPFVGGALASYIYKMK